MTLVNPLWIEAARQKSLVAEGISSQAQYDQAVLAARTARQAIQTARQQNASVAASLSGRVNAPADAQPAVQRAQAALEHDAQAHFAWTFWTIDLDLPAGEHELAVRAWDEAGQTQPALPDDTWNYKGYLSAAWHRVRVTVE